MKLLKIEVDLNDVDATADRTAMAILQLLDACVSKMDGRQCAQFVTGTMAGLAGGIGGRMGMANAKAVFTATLKVLNDVAEARASESQRKH